MRPVVRPCRLASGARSGAVGVPVRHHSPDVLAGCHAPAYGLERPAAVRLAPASGDVLEQRPDGRVSSRARRTYSRSRDVLAGRLAPVRGAVTVALESAPRGTDGAGTRSSATAGRIDGA
jgi:hypothetical protein